MSASERLVLAITPSKDRQEFLVRQLKTFWEPYQNLRKSDPQLPDLKWIIVDETATPCKTLQDSKIDGVTYVHLPSRHDLSTVHPAFRQICADCLYSEDELKDRVRHLAENTRSDRYIVAHNPAIPSIGEMRNVGIAVAASLYMDRDPNAAVFSKDDDDFSSPDAVPALYNILQGYDFAKFGNMLIYEAIPQQWSLYTIKKQDEGTHIIENGQETVIDRYTVWDDKAETKPNPYKHMGIYGCTFAYRLDTAWALGSDQQIETGKFGPFEPLSRREDVAFFDLIAGRLGLDRACVIDNPPEWMVRIVHSNATRTMHHGLVDADTISPETQGYVRQLAGQPANDNRQAPVPDRKPAPVNLIPGRNLTL